MEAKIKPFYTKMIRKKSSISCKNFIKFEEIFCMDLAISGGYTHICFSIVWNSSIVCISVQYIEINNFKNCLNNVLSLLLFFHDHQIQNIQLQLYY
jgi:hypothetical protein